jgi:excisionase family DNA binding protein
MNLYSNTKNVSREDAHSESVHPDLPHRLLNVQEAARLLGLSASTLNKLRLSGNGPLYRKLGRRVLYDPRDLEAWSAERRRSHTSDY